MQNNVKTYQVTARMTRAELMQLDALADQEGVSQAHIIRMAIRELARVKGIPAMRIIEVENKPIRRS